VQLAHIYSGASRDICGRCREYYDANPGMFDPEKASRHAVKVIEIDRGKNRNATDLAVTVALRLPSQRAVEEALVSAITVRREAPGVDAENDVRIKNLERALAELRSMTGKKE
jgi:hypothetical protein